MRAILSRSSLSRPEGDPLMPSHSRGRQAQWTPVLSKHILMVNPHYEVRTAVSRSTASLRHARMLTLRIPTLHAAGRASQPHI